jgi:hypothetical protein
MKLRELIEITEEGKETGKSYPVIFSYEYAWSGGDDAIVRSGWAVVDVAGNDNWVGHAYEVIEKYLESVFDPDAIMLLGVRFIPDWLTGVFFHSLIDQ